MVRQRAVAGVHLAHGAVLLRAADLGVQTLDDGFRRARTRGQPKPHRAFEAAEVLLRQRRRAAQGGIGRRVAGG
ncbi:hypothetical protein G6F57_022826 [Rhizopus arrhizus]|nr:hypothetical protein G6F57_022826 [Rhizopus arrhizus]